MTTVEMAQKFFQEFPVYPEYKDSGIEWLGKIPASWEKKKIKHGYEICLGKMLRPVPLSKEDVLVPYLRTANIVENGTVDVSDVKKMWFSPYEKILYKLEFEDLVIAEGGDVGRSAIWLEELEECYIQNAVHRVRGKKAYFNKFLYYWMFSLKRTGYIDLLCNKATIAHLTSEKLKEISFACSLLIEEQKTIAHFLDQATAEIDHIIDQQQQLIALLEEERTTVISHAVTKGLDPSVPMKDSGVEWLGEIPQHWEVTKNKKIFMLFNGYAFKGEFFSKDEQDAPILVTPGNFNPQGGLYFTNENTTHYTANYPKGFRLELGDQVIVMTDLSYKKMILGQVASIDRPGLLLNQRIGKVIFHSNSRKRICSSFFQYLLNAKCIRDQVLLTARGTTVFHSSPEKIGQCLVTLPLLKEQQLIVKYLDAETARIDEAISNVKDQIAKLEEYSTALISDAITGKIDVRGFVA